MLRRRVGGRQLRLRGEVVGSRVTPFKTTGAIQYNRRLSQQYTRHGPTKNMQLVRSPGQFLESCPGRFTDKLRMQLHGQCDRVPPRKTSWKACRIASQMASSTAFQECSLKVSEQVSLTCSRKVSPKATRHSFPSVSWLSPRDVFRTVDVLSCNSSCFRVTLLRRTS